MGHFPRSQIESKSSFLIKWCKIIVLYFFWSFDKYKKKKKKNSMYFWQTDFHVPPFLNWARVLTFSGSSYFYAKNDWFILWNSWLIFWHFYLIISPYVHFFFAYNTFILISLRQFFKFPMLKLSFFTHYYPVSGMDQNAEFDYCWWKLDWVALLIADPSQCNSTNRQN